jgi:YHS domain-containing protein
MTARLLLLCSSLGIALSLGLGLALAEPDPTGMEGDSAAPLASQPRTALQPLHPLIGEWKGTGQPRRGSNQGAWRETASFSWDFSQSLPAIVYRIDDGKLARQIRLMPGQTSGEYRGIWEAAGAEPRELLGRWQENQLILTTTDAELERITITLLNEQRTLVLFEKRTSPTATFQRVAEVGYTRAGTRLALPGGGQPECVVTGGAASIPVMYEGKTYYVCCTGCKQAFEDDPAGILKEYAARVQAAKAASGK